MEIAYCYFIILKCKKKHYFKLWNNFFQAWNLLIACKRPHISVAVPPLYPAICRFTVLKLLITWFFFLLLFLHMHVNNDMLLKAKMFQWANHWSANLLHLNHNKLLNCICRNLWVCQNTNCKSNWVWDSTLQDITVHQEVGLLASKNRLALNLH